MKVKTKRQKDDEENYKVQKKKKKRPSISQGILMWRRCKYKLRQVRFPGGPRCKGQLHSYRHGLFRLEKQGLKAFHLKLSKGQD